MNERTISHHFSFAYQPWWFTGFAALLALMPLPFGSNRPWASDLFGVLIAVFLFGMAWHFHKAPEAWQGRPPLRRIMISIGLLALIVLWTALQTASWTPASWHHPLWLMTQETLHAPDKSIPGSISIDPTVFAESLTRILGYAACFFIAFLSGRDDKRAKLLLRSLTYASLVYAAYGLLIQSFGGHYVLWYPKWTHDGMLTSTFVNKNSYATYAGLGLVCSLALLWQHIKHMRLPNTLLAQHSRFEAWLQYFTLYDAHYFIMPVVILGALVLSGSRAGFFSSVAGCVSFCLLLAVNRRWGIKRWAIIGATLLLFMLAMFALSGELMSERMIDDVINEDFATRYTAYEQAEQAIAANPLLGYGLGTFENAFRLYSDFSQPLWFQHAHNDYLELIVELGIPAALIFISSILFVLSCCVEGVWKRQRSEVYPIIGLSASVIVGAHAFADFSMQIPAVAATYATLLGLGLSQSWSSRD